VNDSGRSRSLSLEAFLALDHATDRHVDALLATETFPRADPEGVTFAYRGRAEAVRLVHWIYGLESSLPFDRFGGTDLWLLHVELPPTSRVEYKLEVVRDGHGEWIRDPLNDHAATDPFGANSVARAWGYERPDWTLPDPEAPRGRLEELTVDSKALGGRRAARVYVPARFRRTRQYPVLLVHDGEHFVEFGSLDVVLDNLMHRLEIAPMLVVLTQAEDRLREYGVDDRHSRFLTRELYPAVAERYPVIDRPDARGLMGASFGAVASLYGAWCYPGVFDRLLLLSGSFAFTDVGRNRRGPEFEPVVRFINRFRRAPGRPTARIYMGCGTYESLIYENRSLVPLLRDHHIDVRFDEARDGHNWENWRDRLRTGLSWLFPGPLFMVYE